jgi:hypothetical protein
MSMLVGEPVLVQFNPELVETSTHPSSPAATPFVSSKKNMSDRAGWS